MISKEKRRSKHSRNTSSSSDKKTYSPSHTLPGKYFLHCIHSNIKGVVNVGGGPGSKMQVGPMG